jgi:hypothetical protein
MNRRRALGWMLAASAPRGISQAPDGPARLEVGGSAIDVEFEAGDFEVGRPTLPDWVTVSVRAVSVIAHPCNAYTQSYLDVTKAPPFPNC